MTPSELIYGLGGLMTGAIIVGLFWWADTSARREAERRSTESARRMFGE